MGIQCRTCEYCMTAWHWLRWGIYYMIIPNDYYMILITFDRSFVNKMWLFILICLGLPLYSVALETDLIWV